MGIIASVCTSMPPPLPDLYQYWLELRQGRIMPMRRDIDPLHIPKILPYLFLIDVESGGMRRRFRFRLVGTQAVAAWGREYTGCYLDEMLAGEYHDAVHAAYEHVVITSSPSYAEVPFVRHNGDIGRIYRLLVPLSKSGEAPDMLLGGALHSFFPSV